MLHMQTEFTQQDIKDIKIFRSATVFKLEGWANDALVVKTEPSNVQPESFAMTKRAMKLVDPIAGAAKQLSVSEKRALQSLAEAHLSLVARMTDCRMAAYANLGNAAAPWASEIVDVIRNPVWYKMPLQRMTDMGQALDSRMQAQPDKGLLREFQLAFTSKGGMASLGKIVACDLFSGNKDRFNPFAGVSRVYGTTSLDFRTVVNITNIFIAGTGTSRSLTGMDFLDPNTGFRWFDQTIEEVKANYGDAEWTGEYLTDKVKRKKFCADIIWDLNLILSGGNSRTDAGKSWLKATAATRLEDGMIAGGKAIRDGLTQKYKKAPNKPAGLDSRLQALRKL